MLGLYQSCLLNATELVSKWQGLPMIGRGSHKNIQSISQFLHAAWPPKLLWGRLPQPLPLLCRRPSARPPCLVHCQEASKLVLKLWTKIYLFELQLPNLQQTVANTFLIININNSNNLNKFWVAIFTRQGPQGTARLEKNPYPHFAEFYFKKPSGCRHLFCRASLLCKISLLIF